MKIGIVGAEEPLKVASLSGSGQDLPLPIVGKTTVDSYPVILDIVMSAMITTFSEMVQFNTKCFTA